ncbi:hypothetical protein EYF80_027133 [Liparis tanakae]|uniref:Uncharacterized protein n=1 Tax=Liparis tanakae TaxID=230148 RepID=A0A4Z2HD34_9TELE|nr:hypothetical protein EYF80_027133 [Liparis tanakae]
MEVGLCSAASWPTTLPASALVTWTCLFQTFVELTKALWALSSPPGPQFLRQAQDGLPFLSINTLQLLKHPISLLVSNAYYQSLKHLQGQRARLVEALCVIAADLSTDSGHAQLLGVVGQLYPSLQHRVEDVCVELPLHYSIAPQRQVAHMASYLLTQLPVITKHELLIGLQSIPLPQHVLFPSSTWQDTLGAVAQTGRNG